MTPRSSSFRTRLETVLMLASVALAMSRYDFRASEFKSRRILTSSSSRVVGSAIRIASPHRHGARSVRRPWGSIEHCFVPYQYSGHSYDFTSEQFIYVQISPRQRTERWLRPG